MKFTAFKNKLTKKNILQFTRMLLFYCGNWREKTSCVYITIP